MRKGLSLKSSLVLLALVLASGGAVGAVAISAEPSAGTITVDGPPLTWEGNVDVGVPLGRQCTPPFNALPTGTCDTFELSVDIEDKYWEIFDGGVQVVVVPRGPDPGVDLDFRVYDASGAVVASAENAPGGGTTPSSETATIPEPSREAGPYQVVVFSYQLLSGPDAYDASARLDARASAPNSGGTSDAPIPDELVSDAPCQDGLAAGVFPCDNVDLKSFLPISQMGGFTPFESGLDPTADELINDRLNDIWGWTDPSTGKEYAIVGKRDGTSFVDVSDPSNPVYLGSLPTRFNMETPVLGNVWRDIKVYENHAFIVAEEQLHGMQVFDLTQLRGLEPSAQFPSQRTFTETATYDEIGNTHNISINEKTGYAYLIGTNTCDGGSHIVDIREPTEPAFAGCVAEDGYTHDNQCVVYEGPDREHADKEVCFDFNEDTLTIVDVTNKGETAERPQLARLPYSDSAYTHQGWLTPDQKYVLMNDELDETDIGLNTTTRIVDVRDLDDPKLIGIFDHGVPSIDHNNYIKKSTAYQSNYRSGLRILDIRKVADSTLTKAGVSLSGFFDVFPADDAAEFNGTWSNYPYFESGNIIVSGIEQGLFVLRPAAAAGGKDGLYPGEPGDTDGQPGGQGTPTPTPGGGQATPTPTPPGVRPTPTATSGPGVTPPPSCAADGFASARARGRSNGALRLDFARNRVLPVTVDVFQQTAGRRVLGGRLVARYKGRSNGVTWPARKTRKGRNVRNGIYVARFRMAGSVRRIALKRSNGRFKVRPAFHRPATCGVLRRFQLNRPVFGAKKALGVGFALGRAADVRVTVVRKGRVVATLADGSRPAGRTFRGRLAARGLPRGDYRIRLQAVARGERVVATLTARRH